MSSIVSPLQVVAIDTAQQSQAWIDISNYYVHYEIEFTGTEELSNGTITLSAKGGRFLTTAPILTFFNRVYVKIQDKNGKIIDGVFEILNIKPSLKQGQGTGVELLLSHQGWHFWQSHLSKFYQRQSGFEVVEDGFNNYNANVGASDPVIGPSLSEALNPATGIGIGMSEATYNDYDFSTGEMTGQDSVLAVIDKLGSPVAAGGEFDFYEFVLKSNYSNGSGNIAQMDVSIFSSGFVPGQHNPPVPTDYVQIIQNTATPVRVLETGGQIDAIKGTNVLAWAEPTSGSVPPDYSRYVGLKQQYFAANLYNSGITYLTGMRVTYGTDSNGNALFYIARQNVPVATPPPNATYWTLDSFNPLYNGVTVAYSPYTNQKAQYWINASADAKDATNGSDQLFACHDHNLVIRDDNHRRTWVDVFSLNPSTIDSRIYPLSNTATSRGFRILCNGTPGGVLAGNGGNDQYGYPYKNSVIQNNGNNTGTYLDWDVFLSATTDMEVFDFYTGTSWTFYASGGSTGAWNGTQVTYSAGNLVSYNGQYYSANSTIHSSIFNLPPPSDSRWRLASGSVTGTWTKGAYLISLGNNSLIFTPGLQFDCVHPYQFNGSTPLIGNTQGVEPSPFGASSAVYAQYDWSNPLLANYPNQVFWGVNFAYPMPRASYSVPYGAVAIGEQWLPPTFDINNMSLNHLNGRGFNQGLASEDLGPVNALAFYVYFLLRLPGNITAPRGDFKMRIVLYDSSDNVWTADFNHPNNGLISQQIIPISSFQIYRARHADAFLPVTELEEAFNQFETANTIRGAIFWLEPFDSQGRFAGLLSDAFKSAPLGNAFGWVDGFHWVKPLMVTSQEQAVQANKPARNLEPAFMNYPQITNYIQLKNTVQSMLNIYQFQRVEYQIRTPVLCDIPFGGYFYYTNPTVISTTTDGFANTEKLVAKKIVYYGNKGKGTGGHHRLIIGVKRFVAT